MRQSLFVSKFDRTFTKYEDWWPLEKLVDAARRAIAITSRYGRHFPRPPDLVPVVHVQSIEDIRRVGDHAKALVALLQRQHQDMAQITAMPGLLERRPHPEATYDILMDAADRFQEAGKVARQIAGGCLQSVVCDPALELSDPCLKYVITAWNTSLLKMAESYVTHVEGIPDQLQRLLVDARAGQVRTVNICFDIVLDTDPISEAIELRKAFLSEGLPFPGPRAGKIYALVNSSMPGLVKIGKTTRGSKSRANELHTTGVPTPFIVLYEVDVADCDEAEHHMHEVLAGFRVSERREFFRVEPKIAIDAMTAIRLTYTPAR